MKLFDFNAKSRLAAEKATDRPFGRANYIMMAVCVGLIILGFALMSGGGGDNPNEFNPDIFSTRRIVVGPTIAFLGFLLMAFAIIRIPDRKGKNNNENKEK